MYLGIDLAWSPRNKSGIALLSGNQIIYVDCVRELSAIQDLVTRYAPKIIAVDAPLTVNNETGNRKAEQALNKTFRRFDAGCHPVNRKLIGTYNNGVPRGEELKELLDYQENARHKGIIEVYPHAAQIRYFNRNKILKYKKDATLLNDYAQLLQQRASFTLPTAARKDTEDMLDAIMCALIAQSYYEGQTEIFGGHIVVPLGETP